MLHFITLPGIGNSGASHWQSIWEKTDSRFQRFSPRSWDEPDLTDWVNALQAAVDTNPAPIVLVAHSLACLLVAHWAEQSPSLIAGAFLVAPPDPDGSAFPSQAASFKTVPWKALRFPSLIVASTNDPFGSIDYAQLCANRWGSKLIEIGDCGHINGASGLGGWDTGRALLEKFCSV